MKIKEDIIKWRNEVRELTQKVANLEANAKNNFEELQSLKEQVTNLAKITEEMTNAMLALLRQQIGD